MVFELLILTVEESFVQESSQQDAKIRDNERKRGSWLRSCYGLCRVRPLNAQESLCEVMMMILELTLVPTQHCAQHFTSMTQ